MMLWHFQSPGTTPSFKDRERDDIVVQSMNQYTLGPILSGPTALEICRDLYSEMVLEWNGYLLLGNNMVESVKTG